jgi:hypothetical protein
VARQHSEGDLASFQVFVVRQAGSLDDLPQDPFGALAFPRYNETPEFGVDHVVAAVRAVLLESVVGDLPAVRYDAEE